MDFEVEGGLLRKRRLPPPSTGEAKGCLFLLGVSLLGLVIVLICCAAL